MRLIALLFVFLIVSPAYAANELPSIGAPNGTVRATPSAIIVPLDPAIPGGPGCVVGSTGCSLPTTGGGGGGGDVNITQLGGVAVGGVASTQLGSTVTTGGTFQTIIATSATRKGCLVQNTSAIAEPLFVYFGTLGSALTSNSFSLQPGEAAGCSSGLIVLTGAVNVTAATTGHAFTYSAQ